MFAAALLAAERYRPGERPALAWLYGIAAHKLADSRRRGRVEDEARRRLGLDPLAIDDAELARVEEMADTGAAESAVHAPCPPAQRDAVLARVVEERPYAEIADRDAVLGAARAPARQPGAAGAARTDQGAVMSSFFDDLEAQLDAAARAHTTARARQRTEPVARRTRWRWLRTGVRAVPGLVAVAVTVAVVAAALVFFGHGHRPVASPPASPPPGGALAAVFGKAESRQLRREMGYISTATRPVLNSATCQVRQPSAPSVVHGSPGPALLSALGVLRRPATPADRLRAASQDGITDAYAGHTRRAVAAHGTVYYIVPTRDDPATWSPSSRCFSLQTAALARALPTIPASFRAPTRALEAQLIAYARNAVARAPRDTLCLVTVRSGNLRGTDCGGNLAAIQHGGLPTDDNGTFTAIIPDGVATVTLRFAAVQGRRAVSVTGIVHGNVLAVRGPRLAFGSSGPRATVIWRSARGRSTDGPAARARRAHGLLSRERDRLHRSAGRRLGTELLQSQQRLGHAGARRRRLRDGPATRGEACIACQIGMRPRDLSPDARWAWTT